MKMKLIMERFNRFLDEARISPPPTRGEAIASLLDKITQDANVPAKAKQMLKKAADDGNIEHVISTLVLISTLVPEYEGVENEFLELPAKYDYDSGKERREFGAFSDTRLRIDVEKALDSLVNMPNLRLPFAGHDTSKFENPDYVSDEDWEAMTPEERDAFENDPDYIQRLKDEEEDFSYRILGYASPSDARLDVKGQETPAEVSSGAISDEEKAVNNPFGDPFVRVELDMLEDVEMAKKALEANGMRLAPQGLPSATKAKFVNPERTIIDTGRGKFEIKVKYA